MYVRNACDLPEIEELDKPDADVLKLGNRLKLAGQEYESLNEILARYVGPITDLCQDLMNHPKYYVPEAAGAGDGAAAAGEDVVVKRVKLHLLARKKAEPRQNPYVVFYK